MGGRLACNCIAHASPIEGEHVPHMGGGESVVVVEGASGGWGGVDLWGGGSEGRGGSRGRGGGR